MPYAGTVGFGIVAAFTAFQLTFMLGVWGITWAGVRTYIPPGNGSLPSRAANPINHSTNVEIPFQSMISGIIAHFAQRDMVCIFIPSEELLLLRI